jgi:hypothetical protein
LTDGQVEYRTKAKDKSYVSVIAPQNAEAAE